MIFKNQMSSELRTSGCKSTAGLSGMPQTETDFSSVVNMASVEVPVAATFISFLSSLL